MHFRVRYTYVMYEYEYIHILTTGPTFKSFSAWTVFTRHIDLQLIWLNSFTLKVFIFYSFLSVYDEKIN